MLWSISTFSRKRAKDVLVRLWSVREEFRRSYAALLDRLALARRPVLVLTVYNPCFQGHGFDGAYQQAAESAVSIIDDVIQQEGRSRSFDILELRTLFDDRAITLTRSSLRRLEAQSWRSA
jgi:hypothetical protein